MTSFKSELAGVTGTVIDKTLGTGNLTRMCDCRITMLEGLVQTVEDALSNAHTQASAPPRCGPPARPAVGEFQALANTDEYRKDPRTSSPGSRPSRC